MLQHALEFLFPTHSGLYLFVSKDKRFHNSCNMLLSFERGEECNILEGPVRRPFNLGQTIEREKYKLKVFAKKSVFIDLFSSLDREKQTKCI